MPRPGSKVIPDGWEAHHAPVAEGVMTATCTITRPTHGTFDATAGKSTYPTPGAFYDGPCRVQAVLRYALITQAGEKPTTTRRYMVGLPLTAAQPNINDVVTITAVKDAAFVGTKMIVVDVAAGSLVWERDLMCEVYVPTTR